jgi:hypothetical protein
MCREFEKISDGLQNEIANIMKYRMYECTFVSAPTKGAKVISTVTSPVSSAPDLDLAHKTLHVEASRQRWLQHAAQ